MRKFLCQNGIPNYDTNELTQDEHTDLLRWTAFANVPVKDSTSIKKLEYVHVLTEPMNLLAQIGFEDSGTGSYYHKATNQTYDSLEQLRSVLRGMSDLMGAGDRRKTKMPLSEDQVLQLRLWAALSKEPLPVFCSWAVRACVKGNTKSYYFETKNSLLEYFALYSFVSLH